MKKLITFYFLIFTLSIPSPVSAWDVGSWAGVRKISGDLTVTGGLRTATSAGNTLLLQAYDVDGAAFTTFATLTANNTPTLDLATGVTIGSAYIYRVGGTDISLVDGGTAASLTASTGGIFYSTATAGAILAGTATVNQVLLSGSSAAPTWSTATYPATTTANQIVYSSSANTLAGLATGNSGLLVTSGVGVPSIGTDIPTAVTIGAAYVYRVGGTDVSLADGGTNASLTANNGGIFYSTAAAGAILAGTATANQVLMSGATAAPSWSTATFPATAAGAGTILRADGTNWVATTATFPTTTTANQLLYSSAANVVGGLTSAASGLLVTSGVGVPSIGTDIPTAVTIGAAYIYRAGGTDVSIADGGTGVGSWTNGQLLIGNTTGNTAALATLTGTANQITVTNGASTITLATPQDLSTASTPQFARMGLGVAAHATDITSISSTNTTVGSKALNIAHTGAIAGAGYAGYFSKTGASTTNIAGYFEATGATNNYGVIVANGNSGFGTVTPRGKLDVRDTFYLGTTNVSNGFINSDGSLLFNIDADNDESGNFVRVGTNRTEGTGGTDLLTIQENGNVFIGTTTSPTASTKVVVSDTTQLVARLGLTGQEYFQAANTSTDGLGLVLGVNRLNNRQLWLGDTAALAQNSTNSIIRLSVGGTGTPTIDAMATDGTTTKALALGNAGGVQYGKATVALGAGVSATLGTIGGSGPTVAGQNSWIQMKDSTGADVWVPAWK